MYQKNNISSSPYEKAGLNKGSGSAAGFMVNKYFEGLSRAYVSLRQPDTRVLVHEFGHVFREDLDPQLLKEASEWAGATWDSAQQMWRWNTDAEEKFTIEFERYINGGEAPTPKLKTVFEQLKAWLREIWKAVAKDPDAVVHPKIRDTFDKMFGKGGVRPPVPYQHSEKEYVAKVSDIEGWTPQAQKLYEQMQATKKVNSDEQPKVLEALASVNPAAPIGKQTLGERIRFGKRYTEKDIKDLEPDVKGLVLPSEPTNQMIANIRGENFHKLFTENDIRSPDLVIKPVLEAVEHNAGPMRHTLATLKQVSAKALSGLNLDEQKRLIVALDDPTGKFRDQLVPDLRWRFDALRDVLDRAYVIRWGKDTSHYRMGYFTHLNKNKGSFESAGIETEYKGSRFWNRRTGELMPDAAPAEVMDVYLNSVIRDAYLRKSIKPITAKLEAIKDDLTKPTIEYTRRFLDVVMGVHGTMPSAIESSVVRRIYAGLLGGNVNAALLDYTQLTSTVADLGLKNTINGIKRLSKEGMLTAQQHGAVENSDHMWNDSLKQLSSPVRRVVASIDNFLMAPKRNAEMRVRAITYFAALEEAEKSLGFTGKAAVDYALFKVNELMFNASKYNTAPVLSDNVIGRLAKVFQTYTIRQTQLMGTWGARALKGDQRSQKALARLGASLSLLAFMANEAGLDWSSLVDWFPGIKMAQGRNPLSNPMTQVIEDSRSFKNIVGTFAKLIPGYILLDRTMRNVNLEDLTDPLNSHKSRPTYENQGFEAMLEAAAEDLLTGKDQRPPRPPKVYEYKTGKERILGILGIRTKADVARKQALDAMGQDQIDAATERRLTPPKSVPKLKPQPKGQKPDKLTQRFQQVPRLVKAGAVEPINRYREAKEDPYFGGLRSMFGR